MLNLDTGFAKKISKRVRSFKQGS